MEVGEFEEDSLTKPRTLPPRLIYTWPIVYYLTDVGPVDGAVFATFH